MFSLFDWLICIYLSHITTHAPKDGSADNGHRPILCTTAATNRAFARIHVSAEHEQAGETAKREKLAKAFRMPVEIIKPVYKYYAQLCQNYCAHMLMRAFRNNAFIKQSKNADIRLGENACRFSSAHGSECAAFHCPPNLNGDRFANDVVQMVALANNNKPIHRTR